MPSRRHIIEVGAGVAGVAGGVVVSQLFLRRGRTPPGAAVVGPLDGEPDNGDRVGSDPANGDPANGGPADGGPANAHVGTGPVDDPYVATAFDHRALGVAPTLVSWLPGDVEEHVLTLSDGTRLRVLARGTGPAVVLVHGITLSADVWCKQLQQLSDAGLRVVAPDLRGHGRSTVGSGGLRLDRVADDIAELLQRLDLDDVVVVGHSMGGMLVLRLLTRDRPLPPAPPASPASPPLWASPASPPLLAAPGVDGPEPVIDRVTVSGPDDVRRRVRALGLVATSASPVVGRGVPGARALIALAGPVIGATSRLAGLLPGPSLPDTDLGDPLARVAFGDDPAVRDVRLIRRVTARVPARVAAALLVQLVSFDAERHLGRVAVPTTVIVGTEDVMTPQRHAETLAAAIPAAELVVLPGCGHMVMLERPNELAAAILALVRRAGIATGPVA